MRGLWFPMVIGAIALVVFAGVAIVRELQPKPAACAVSDAAFLASADLPGFQAVLDGGQNGTAPPASGATSGFEFSRMRGWVTSVAAKAGAPSPSLPLTGSIVTDHPGMLEVFETHYVYDSTAAATAFFDALKAGRDNAALTAPGTTLRSAPTIADDSATGFSAAFASGSDPRTTEQGVTYVLEAGSRVIVVAARGGAQLSVDQVRGLANTAADHVLATCPKTKSK